MNARIDFCREAAKSYSDLAHAAKHKWIKKKLMKKSKHYQNIVDEFEEVAKAIDSDLSEAMRVLQDEVESDYIAPGMPGREEWMKKYDKAYNDFTSVLQAKHDLNDKIDAIL